MSITINLPPDLENQLRASSAASGVSAEEIVIEALSSQLSCPPLEPNLADLPCLTAEESEILRHINSGFSEYEWERYHQLIERRRAETLTAAEQQELVGFTDRREAYNVKRLEKLIELARLRGTTLDQVMDQLGIRPAFHV